MAGLAIAAISSIGPMLKLAWPQIARFLAIRKQALSVPMLNIGKRWANILDNELERMSDTAQRFVAIIATLRVIALAKATAYAIRPNGNGLEDNKLRTRSGHGDEKCQQVPHVFILQKRTNLTKKPLPIGRGLSSFELPARLVSPSHIKVTA